MEPGLAMRTAEAITRTAFATEGPPRPSIVLLAAYTSDLLAAALRDDATALVRTLTALLEKGGGAFIDEGPAVIPGAVQRKPTPDTLRAAQVLMGHLYQ